MARTLRRSVVVACALLTGGAATASADWTLAGYLGAGSTLSSALRIVQPSAGIDLTFSPVDWRGESFTPPVYYGYRLGYVLPFSSRLAVEAEFIHLKVYAETSAAVAARGRAGMMAVDRSQRLDETVQGFSISHGANFVLANVAYRQPLGGATTDRVTLVARAGVGPTVPHAESTISGVTDPGEYVLGSLGWQAAAGVELRLVKGLQALGEYKFTRTRQTVRVPGGDAHTLLRTHHVVFGLGYQF